MTTKFTITVRLSDGDFHIFKDAATFEMMSQGLLFIEMPYAKEEQMMGRILRGVKTKGMRYWIPFAKIKDIKVETTKTITDHEELKKYQKFLEHGIDISVTKISHTEPPDPKDVAEKIEKEEAAKRKSDKAN